MSSQPPGVASTTLRMPVDEHLTERAATLAEVFHDAVRALNPPLVQTVVIDEANTPEFWYCGGAASLRSPPMSRYVRLSGETPTAYKSEIGRSGRGGERARAHAHGDELTNQVLGTQTHAAGLLHHCLEDVFQQLARVSTSKVREQRIDQWRFDSYQLGTPSGWIRNVGLKSIVGALFWMESGGLDGLVPASSFVQHLISPQLHSSIAYSVFVDLSSLPALLPSTHSEGRVTPQRRRWCTFNIRSNLRRGRFGNRLEHAAGV
ncbi:hypothetical protein B0H11DRAFT_1924346 [Mycena galericulata]|nr:hypothetical protein B0H11DRAFT_1924346 [Mycena galericulata]